MSKILLTSGLRILYVCSDAEIVYDTCQGQHREFIVLPPRCRKKLFECPSYIGSLVFSCHESIFDVSCLRIITLYCIIFVCVIDAGIIRSTMIVSVLTQDYHQFHRQSCPLVLPPRFLFSCTLRFAILLRGRHCWSSGSY
jgi:hypothetical protein